MIRLDLKNCLFIVTGPTHLWMCRLKIFYLTSKCKKKKKKKKKEKKLVKYFILPQNPKKKKKKKRKKNELNLLPKVTDYFNPKFQFSNAFLNSVEYLFPSTKN